MSFCNPSSLSDSELLEDLEAGMNVLPEIMASNDIPQKYKDEITQHVKELIKEQEKRDNQEYMFPLSAFGIVDFL